MSVHYSDDRVTVHHGDCLSVLTADELGYDYRLGYADPAIPDASVDAVVTDPPYGLANTDPAHVADTVTRWVNGDRDYLPGGSGFMGKAWDAFVHRGVSGFTVAGEGKERRDLAHTPEARQWEGWGTALKPAHEPIVVARKPLGSTVAANVLQHGTGALNIDACRVDGEATTVGRWPTNVVLDEHTAVELDRQSGERPAGGKVTGNQASRTGANGIYGDFGAVETNPYGDAGGASRFFPTFRYEAKAPTAERPKVNGTAHPTVKPLDLMRWLVRLVTPPGGIVLDPFAGSGTTGEACVVERVECVLIEREADYLPLITQRIHRRRNPVEAVRQVGGDLGLFDFPNESETTR